LLKIFAKFIFLINRTVDSFERKLEDAQRELGVAPRDFVPVVYVSETNWFNEAAK
jgi:hypothetical protein